MKSCQTNLIFLLVSSISLVDNGQAVHDFSWAFDSALFKIISGSLGKDSPGWGSPLGGCTTCRKSVPRNGY